MEHLLHVVGLCPDSNTHVNLVLMSANEMRHYLLTIKTYVLCLMKI
jgi:hypothetical protein